MIIHVAILISFPYHQKDSLNLKKKRKRNYTFFFLLLSIFFFFIVILENNHSINSLCNLKVIKIFKLNSTSTHCYFRFTLKKHLTKSFFSSYFFPFFFFVYKESPLMRKKNSRWEYLAKNVSGRFPRIYLGILWQPTWHVFSRLCVSHFSRVQVIPAG